MLYRVKKYTLGSFVLLTALFFISQVSFAQPYVCLPTCNPIDARFLTFGGQDLNTFVFTELTFGVGSPAGSQTLEIGIFDGETAGLWDAAGPGAPLEFTLFADPLGDASGTIMVGQWTSDGSGGLNVGDPMPDNDWFNIVFDNVFPARAESGNYLYFMSVRNTDTNEDTVKNYKIRTDGTLFIFPGDQPFAYEGGLRATGGIEVFQDVLRIIYPQWVPLCGNIGPMGIICDPNDPDCCLFGSTYDGIFTFFFLNEDAGRIFIDFWDGDLDFGILFPDEGPPFEDTDDLNTPAGIPSFADVGNTNPQTSAGSNPIDDNIFPVFVRPPNITYELIDPNGNSYKNDNPSATNEWELFQLNTEPGCAPFICDIEVSSIPEGIWEVRISGMDMSNINFIRAFDKFIGVDDDDNPVIPLGPDRPPVNVPTFSEWGLIAMAGILGLVGFIVIRRRKAVA